jgi:hypothetical protein
MSNKVEHRAAGVRPENSLVKWVRMFIEDDVLIQEFEILDGPRAGQILTLRSRFYAR